MNCELNEAITQESYDAKSAALYDVKQDANKSFQGHG